jgi:hypothetical protein
MLGYEDRYQEMGGKVQLFIEKWAILWIIEQHIKGIK